jgi:hypothetical protein
LTLSAPVQQAIEAELSAKFGVNVQIADDMQNFRSSSVYRCALQQSPGGTAPNRVIVRVPREGTIRSGRMGLSIEQAALEYLASLGSTLAPRFLAGGGAAGFVVTEDLGNHPSLLDILLAKDPEAAGQGMIAFARGLGRLHTQTAGQPESIHAALPVVRVPVVEHWQQVQKAVMQLGLPTPQQIEGDIEAITCLLAESGGCLSLSNGDCSVVNCQISDGNIRFFDFEEACFQYPLIDAAVLRFPYPTGGPPWYLPPEVTLKGEAAYRAELAKVCPVAQDDNQWERGMAAAVAAWTILRLTRLPKVDAGPDRDAWRLLPSDWSASIPIRSRRQQLVSILETCIDSIHRADTFESFGAWCERLADALRERWPEAAETLPLYPAFV